jgi:hypothetical protein
MQALKEALEPLEKRSLDMLLTREKELRDALGDKPTGVKIPLGSRAALSLL